MHSIAIIGTGFGGLGMAWHLRRAGIDDFVIFEKGLDVGGTWRENIYPGAGCDVPSHLYSFSFESDYPWAWRYAKQDEILAYLRHCALKFDLMRHIRFGAEVAGADFDAARGAWNVKLAGGETDTVRFLVSAVGQLDRPAIPALPGMQSFHGTAFHSANWDHAFDVRGKSIAVIGTGASAVQFVPEIAPLVRQLYVFQRSPGWTVPKVEKILSPLKRRLFAVPWLRRLDRARSSR